MEEKSSGCDDCKTWEEEMYWNYFKCMQFFVSLPNDFHDRLVLPGKFADNMKAKLPDKVSLIGPSGTSWDVELLKNDHLLIVGDGWKDFVKAYDLIENCLLLFKYKQSSSFEVLMFDREDMCEKEASYFVKKCLHTKPASINHKKRAVSEASSTEVIEENDEDDDVGEFIASKKLRKDLTEGVVCLGTRNNPKRTRKYPAVARGGYKPRRVVVPRQLPSKRKAKSVNKSSGNGAARFLNRISEMELSASEDEETYLITSENGETFGEMNQSPKSSGNIVSSAKRVPPMSTKKLVFQSKLKAKSVNKPSGNGAARVLNRISDMELTTPENEETYQITPENGETLGEMNQSPKSSGKGGNSAKRVRPISTKSLVLKSKLKAKSVNKPIGNGAARVLSRISEMELTTPENEESQETYQISPENEEALGEMNQFPKSSGNGGNSAKRVLPISTKKLVFKSAQKRLQKEYMSNRRPVTEMEKKDALRRAKLKLHDKSFIAVMVPTNVYKRFYLTIPSEYMNKHFPCQHKRVVLRVGEKTWLTMFNYSRRKSGGIASGWKTFAVENVLEEYDVCLFKLASEKSDPAIVLDVQIFRVIPEVTPPSPVVSSLLR